MPASEQVWCFGKSSVEEAIAAIGRGEVVCVVDDEDRENEGDFIIAAEKATKATLAFMIRYSSGVICCAIEGARADALLLPDMVAKNEDAKCTAFTVSTDLKAGITTGVPGGVLARDGHTEASVDLARLAGCSPAGALVEITTEDGGDMMRVPELRLFAQQHKLVLTSIQDLKSFRMEKGV
ncbi:3,4-dihydroxy-2-butanone 4-phosphate synthase [Baffinella frigidus]|nr:3,4-dihydroxy-2-butanone 4-phosphate synthase [Cryptophyta sp. CCMP2293]